jgi:hypothetical protein
MKEIGLARLGLAVCFLFGASAAFAQQEAGDKEVGLSGLAFFTHTSSPTGSLNLEGSIGKFYTANQYVGVTIGPSLQFGGGSTTGSLFYGGEYRHLSGSKNSKLWPFLGVQGGGDTNITKTTGGGSSTTSNTTGFVAPEFGLKFYASQRTSFEVSYQLQIRFGQGINGGFGDRSQSLVVFGFKHLF